MEIDTCNIINVFINMAIYITKMVFKEGRLVVYQKYNASLVKISEIGIVGGPLDYITSSTAGDIDIVIGF